MAKVDWFAIDTAVRVSAPLAFEVAVFRGADAELLEHAQKLRGLAPVVDRRSAKAARSVAVAARARAAPPTDVSWAASAAADAADATNLVAYATYAAAAAAARDAVYAADDVGFWRRVHNLGPRSAHFIRMLDLDVHSTPELETALVATDYALEHGASHDDKLRMETLLRFKPIVASIEASGFHAPTGLDNRFRRPVWVALPGAEAAYPGWSTFMAWPTETTRKWIDLLIDAVAKET